MYERLVVAWSDGSATPTTRKVQILVEQMYGPRLTGTLREWREGDRFSNGDPVPADWWERWGGEVPDA